MCRRRWAARASRSCSMKRVIEMSPRLPPLTPGLSLTPRPPLPLRGEGEQEKNLSLALRAGSSAFLPLSPEWERGPGGEGRSHTDPLHAHRPRPRAVEFAQVDHLPLAQD